MPTTFVRTRSTGDGRVRFDVLYRAGGRKSRLLSAGTFGSKADADATAELVRGRLAAGEPVGERIDRRVYFAQLGGLIKIGVSIHPERRARAINARLLAVKSGGIELERRLHKQFAHLRHRGEWFTDAPELRAYIAAEAREVAA